MIVYQNLSFLDPLACLTPDASNPVSSQPTTVCKQIGRGFFFFLSPYLTISTLTLLFPSSPDSSQALPFLNYSLA